MREGRKALVVVWVLRVSLEGPAVVTLEISTEGCLVGLAGFVVVS